MTSSKYWLLHMLYMMFKAMCYCTIIFPSGSVSSNQGAMCGMLKKTKQKNTGHILKLIFMLQKLKVTHSEMDHSFSITMFIRSSENTVVLRRLCRQKKKKTMLFIYVHRLSDRSINSPCDQPVHRLNPPSHLPLFIWNPFKCYVLAWGQVTKAQIC